MYSGNVQISSLTLLDCPSLNVHPDQVFVSATWLSLFPSCKLVNLVAGVSNHSPIILHIVVVDRVRRQSIFKVENVRLQEEAFHNSVTNSWEVLRGRDLITRLGSCSESMANWGEDFNRKFRKKIADFQAKIKKLRLKNLRGFEVHYQIS